MSWSITGLSCSAANCQTTRADTPLQVIARVRDDRLTVFIPEPAHVHHVTAKYRHQACRRAGAFHDDDECQHHQHRDGRGAAGADGLAGDTAAVAAIRDIHDDDASGLAAHGPVRTASGVDRWCADQQFGDIHAWHGGAAEEFPAVLPWRDDAGGGARDCQLLPLRGCG